MNRKDRITRARAGGTARGHQERLEALARYNTKPHICKNCFNQIPVGERRVADVIKKQFCNYSCASTHRNAQRRLENLTVPQAPA